MKTVTIFSILLLAAGLIGCGKQQQPRHIIILPDVSGSIDRNALEQAFKAIDELVGHLKRGDRIAVIPILGDAQAEASGRIIRFEVPTERKAYDADLRDFRQRLAASLTLMQTNAAAHPGSKTDILGSIELAAQEFQLGPHGSKRLLIILSDFIQEDKEIDFKTDKRIANGIIAKQFGLNISTKAALHFKGISFYLGLLRSHEYLDLSRSRREGLQEFWIEYFRASGGESKFFTDGPGMLPEGLQLKTANNL